MQEKTVSSARRKFLKSSAAMGLAGASIMQSGCATTGLLDNNGRPLEWQGVDKKVEKLNIGLDGIDEGGMFAEGQQKIGPISADLFKTSLRTMLTMGWFGDLSPGERLHPGVQSRMRTMLPEMNTAVLGVTDFLENVGDTELRELQFKLETTPDAANKISDAIETPGRMYQVSLKRRLHFRTLVNNAVWRLQKKPGLLINDYVTKIRKIEANSGLTEALRREALEEMSQDSFWVNEEQLVEYWRQQAGGPPNEQSPPKANSKSSTKYYDSPSKSSNRAFKFSGITLGISAAVFFGGVIIEAFPLALLGLVGLTVGVIGLIVGIIMAIAGS